MCCCGCNFCEWPKAVTSCSLHVDTVGSWSTCYENIACNKFAMQIITFSLFTPRTPNGLSIWISASVCVCLNRTICNYQSVDVLIWLGLEFDERERNYMPFCTITFALYDYLPLILLHYSCPTLMLRCLKFTRCIQYVRTATNKLQRIPWNLS